MGRRTRLAARLLRNVCRRNKLSLFCVLGLLSLLYINQGDGVWISLGQYNVFLHNYTRSAGQTQNLNTATQPQAEAKTEITKPLTTPVPDGFALSRAILSSCTPLNSTRLARPPGAPRPEITVRYTHDKGVMFCPVYKVGSTFWRRIFMMETQAERSYLNAKHPYQIPFDKELKGLKYRIRLNQRRNFTFMFTRDPYSRLFSTYVDKLLAPNPYYWKALGEKILKFTRSLGTPGKKLPVCAHDVTFPEFIKFVIHSLEHNKDVDPHFVQMNKNCHPCDVKYDFIGKMENFARDSTVCLEKMNLRSVAEILKVNGSDLAAQDAMLDTLTQPFSFRRTYMRCIPVAEALQRSWKKLQIRGLIGDNPLDLVTFGKGFDGLTLKTLMAHAQEVRRRSSSRDRKKLKRHFYEEYWKQINVTDLYKIRSLYSMDFKLFNYDPEPVAVFQNRKPDNLQFI